MFDSERINREAFRYYARLARVKGYVEEHTDELVPAIKAAEIAGLERAYFSRFFHEKTGVCYRDWIKHVRICDAIECLKAQNQAISKLAFQLGFRDLRSFERAFKNHTGQTPRAFKNASRPS